MVFRYPGGKTKLLKNFEHLLLLNASKRYFEPFVGGGSVTIHVAKKYPKLNLYINDLDKYIYSFWKLFETDCDSEFERLYKLIEVVPTVELFYKLRKTEPKDNIELAYYAIFFNRTTFSGIFSSGPIGGYEQKSEWKINCRYNSKNIINKIKKMRVLLSKRIFVFNEDCLAFLSRSDSNLDFIYLDPPYFAKSADLYNHFFSYQDHVNLKNCISKKINWLLSYDNCKEILNIYDDFKIIPIDCQYSINGKKETLNYTKEIVILSNNLQSGMK